MREQRNRDRQLISIADAATRLGSCTKTVRRLIASGNLRAYRVKGTNAIRLDVEDVDRLLVQIPTSGSAA